MPEFLDIPNIFQNLSADQDTCTTFPILSNLGPSFGALWDSKAAKNEHKAAWDPKEWHHRVSFVGVRAPCGPQSGSEPHFAPPEAPPGAHFVCSWLQFLDQVVQTLHELLHLFLDGLPILC